MKLLEDLSATIRFYPSFFSSSFSIFYFILFYCHKLYLLFCSLNPKAMFGFLKILGKENNGRENDFLMFGFIMENAKES